MSYCRWSSMNWMCDVYVYEDVSGGWTTHVAWRRRIIQPIPELSWHIYSLSKGEYNRELRKIEYPTKYHAFLGRTVSKICSFWHNKIHMASLRLIPLKNIGLPHDGETFNSETAKECAELLTMLKGIGYKVPDYAIEALLEEGETE